MKWTVALTFTSVCERISYTLTCNKISVFSFLERNRHAKSFCRLMEDIIQVLYKPCGNGSEEQMLPLCKKSFAFGKKKIDCKILGVNFIENYGSAGLL